MKTLKRIAMAALYIRLSKDDDGVGESSSITTQRKMLRAYCQEHGYIVFDEYVDDGWSGTNFERPEFKRMIADIEAGKINLVVTKDLSRLGRDYITSGEYTERYFPERGVRYIAINDGYDSDNQWNDVAPFKHVINEMYARDTSKKIRSAFVTKMREGSYIGSFAPFGYQKDPQNKNHLTIDYEVSHIVQEIFQRAKDGERPVDIARSLNDRHILTPAQYRCMKRPNLDIANYTQRQEWTSSTICKMLRNVVYLGHTAQGKTSKVSFKSQVTLTKEREDWFVVENTHHPIIDQVTFDIVRKKSMSRKIPPKTDFKNIFSGLAKCADCGRSMSTTGTRKTGAIYNLVCGGYKLYGKKECSNHFIDYTTLYNVVLKEIQKQLVISEEDKRAILSELEGLSSDKPEANSEIQEMIDSLKRRSQEIDRVIQKMYEDSVSGKITEDRFDKMYRPLESEQSNIAERIKTMISTVPAHTHEDGDKYKKFFKLIQDMTEIESLSPEVLNRLVDKIEVGQGYFEEGSEGKVRTQKVRIHFKFIGAISQEIA